MIWEVIHYTSELTLWEIQRVNSYLATKYWITLDQSIPQDYVSASGELYWDWMANSWYKYNITVIGRDDISQLNQKQSKSRSSINADWLVTVWLWMIAPSNESNTNVFDADWSYMAFWDDDWMCLRKNIKYKKFD